MVIKKSGDAYTVQVSEGYAKPYVEIKPCEEDDHA
jgi:hypothetical protein